MTIYIESALNEYAEHVTRSDNNAHSIWANISKLIDRFVTNIARMYGQNQLIAESIAENYFLFLRTNKVSIILLSICYIKKW